MRACASAIRRCWLQTGIAWGGPASRALRCRSRRMTMPRSSGSMRAGRRWAGPDAVDQDLLFLPLRDGRRPLRRVLDGLRGALRARALVARTIQGQREDGLGALHTHIGHGRRGPRGHDARMLALVAVPGTVAAPDGPSLTRSGAGAS